MFKIRTSSIKYYRCYYQKTLRCLPVRILYTFAIFCYQCYPLCPYCYSNPPFRDMRKGMGCNECTHPTCQHAMTQNSVSNCVECDNGMLVLDVTSAPKWRMACNKLVSSLLIIICYNSL